MKKIVFLLVMLVGLGLFSSFTVFGNDEKENNVNLGLGVFYRNSVYKQDDDNEVLPVPFIGIQYKDFYYEAPIELGYHFYKTENLTLTAYGRYNLYTGYKPEDLIDEFKDMEKRKDDIHLGLRERYNFVPLGVEIISHVSGDVSGRSDGILARMEINKPLPFFQQKFIIQPYIAAEYMSESYTDYYFGITKEEASKNINHGEEYKVSDSFNFEAGIRSIVDINRNFKLLVSAGYTRYGNSIADSPLVKDKDIFTIGGGISYNFPF